jgi:biopolymer transport protein ExbD
MGKLSAKNRAPPAIPTDSFGDIAFLLIIFFVVATKLVQKLGVVAEMPSGQRSSTPSAKSTTVQIVDNRLLLDNEQVDGMVLRERLRKKELAKQSGDARVVVIEASGEVNYQAYFDVMATISGAGGVIAIATEEEGKGKAE